MEPTQLPDESNTPSPNTQAATSSEPAVPSANTSYREPVDLDAMMRGEEPAAFSSIPADEEKGAAHGVSQSPQTPDTTITIPDTSVAKELRKKSTKSPISRGAAPHLTAIAEEIKREKEVIDPHIVKRDTLEGDPLFASHVMGEKKEAAKESKEVAEKREEEAIKRGHKKAEEVGEAHKLKSLRTFESDIAAAMKGEKTSMVQMVLAEHRKEERKKEIVVEEKKRSLYFLWGSIVLIIAAIVVIGIGVWYVFVGTNTSPFSEVIVEPIVFAEDHREFKADELSTVRLRESIAQEIATATLSPNSIKHLYVTELVTPLKEDHTPYREAVSTERFFILIGDIVPDWLIRSLGTEHMLGVHAWNSNQTFFIFTTSNFDTAFSSMLSWESDIADDIFPLIGVRTDEETYTRDWEDILVRNRDMRVLKDNSGHIVLAYTFFDSETLILATSIDTIDEIIARIIQKRREK
jgi:hypothetical protein